MIQQVKDIIWHILGMTVMPNVGEM